MKRLAPWLEELRARIAPLEPGQRIGAVVREMHGCSCRVNKHKLYDLFEVNEPDRAHAINTAEARTNCATGARCVLAVCDSDVPLVWAPYPGQVAVDWIRKIAVERDALISLHEYPNAWEQIEEGYLLHYNHPGTNLNHIEIALGKPDLTTGVCEHGGAGKADNGFEVVPADDIRRSTQLHRPLIEIIRPDRLFPVM